MTEIVPKSIQTWFEQVLGQIFRKIFAQFSMECRVFETFQKKSKNFQNSNQKRTKPFPKESKSVLNMFLGKFFEKFLPSFPWKVESSKIFKKIKKISKFQKCPKSFPKVFKLVLNKFWGKFFEKFLPSFPWSVESSKHFKKNQEIFKNHTKNAPNRSKRIQKCFEHVFGQIFRKIFAQFSMEGRVFENFQKNKKTFKIPKRPKIVPKSIQTSSERVLRQFFRKIFAQFSMEGRVFENFQKKTKNFQSSKKSRKSLPKVSKRVLNLFWGKFFQKNFLPSVPWMVESSKIFKKIKKSLKFRKGPKSFPKVSKRVLNVF